MSRTLVIDTENLTLNQADCDAIQTSVDATPHTRVETDNIILEKADVTNLNAALNSSVLEVDGPNLFLQVPEMTRVKAHLTGA